MNYHAVKLSCKGLTHKVITFFGVHSNSIDKEKPNPKLERTAGGAFIEDGSLKPPPPLNLRQDT